MSKPNSYQFANDGITLQSLNNMGEKIQQNQYISKLIQVPISHEEPKHNLIPLQNQKFVVQQESFNETYLKNDHLQQFYNKRALNHFAQTITYMYSQNQQPISILDVCCGHGKPTQSLREMLQNNGVQIEKIVGYDISEAMINFANENNKFQPKVQFYKKNIQTQLAIDVSQYDVVICLFGLHWMNNLEGTIASIHRSLKPNGIFLSQLVSFNVVQFELFEKNLFTFVMFIVGCKRQEISHSHNNKDDLGILI